MSNDAYKGEIVNISNQTYQIRITLYNINSKEPFVVPFSVVNDLVIQEDLVNWWTKGWISIRNDFEAIERGSPYNRQEYLKNFFERNGYFKFRHDARNKLNIRITTLSDDTKINDEDWTMDYDFIIYDVQDMESGSVNSKSRKFYFIDERYQIFSERNIPWSTATHGPASKTGKKISELTDDQRKMNPCSAIASIINTSAANKFSSSESDASTLMVGYSDAGSIDDPDIKLNNIDESLWNIPSNNESDVFYTSPANSTVLDDLDFMLNHAVGKDGDPVFLRFDRFKKTWQLVSLIDYFKKAKQIERVLLNDGIDPLFTGKTAYVSRAQVTPDGNNKIINFFSPKTSIINSYKFSQMSPVDDARLINRPIHKYDFSTGTYNIFSEQNKVTQIYEKIKNAASLGGLFSHSTEGTKPQIWQNINKTKLEGLSIENSFYTQGSNELNVIKMMKDFFFLNQTLYFQNHGLTLRSPGNFIFVDRVDSSDKNTFDDKFLGQWFITKVVHYFSKDQYLTDVYSSKIDGVNNHWDVLDSKQY
jgi:hypothetical protein